MQAASNIIELRRFLAERLPQVRTGFAPPRPRHVTPSGLPALDAALDGGLPRGGLTEVVAGAPGAGGAQVLHALLEQTARAGRFLALADGADSFDVDAVAPAVLARLLWVRCGTADLALRAADLLLRDRNFPLVAIDLQLNPASQLRRLSGAVWHRCGRLAEQHGTTVLVLTPVALVGGAAARVRVGGGPGPSGFTAGPGAARAGLRFGVLRPVDRSSPAGEEPAVRRA